MTPSPHTRELVVVLPADEGTPLMSSKGGGLTKVGPGGDTNKAIHEDQRIALHLFLEAKTLAGATYEKFTICLIVLSVLTFVLSSVFVAEYNPTSPYPAMCGKVCDAIWFGNKKDNALAFLGIGSTSIVELLVVGIFSIDYLLRFYTADLDNVKFVGVRGRLRYIVTFFSLVDLASTVPFYVDAFILTHMEFAASNFLRMFRLLRMMKAGKYDTAFSLIDDVLYAQKAMLGTAAFVGMTVWGVLSSFYYIVERENPNMIYCGAAPGCDDVDTSLCVTDEWGLVDCTDGGCPSGTDGQEVCWNLYRSIVSSSFWTLIELFGEFPLIDMHSTPWGRVLGTFTAVFAVAVFALPVGVLASGFEDQIAKRHAAEKAAAAAMGGHEEVPIEAEEVVMGGPSLRGRVYDFLHRKSSHTAELFVRFTRILIICCALSFVVDSVFGYTHHHSKPPSVNFGVHHILVGIQLIAAFVFAVEYGLKMFSAGENPKYAGLHGLFTYQCEFHRIIDFLSIIPYFVGMILFPASPAPSFFLLLRIFHFEQCSDSFTVFDDIIIDNLDVLSVTGFAAGLLWIFFSSVLYFTERDNPDEEMAGWYSNIPNSMWMTMLNLSGECPLANYTTPGKIIIGIIGLFATAIFGVPIGILGAGFEELIAEKYEDKPDEDETTELPQAPRNTVGGVPKFCYDFVNGEGSKVAETFEVGIFFLIGLTVTLGVIQTVPEWKDVGSTFEWVAVIIFTVEYIMRFIGSVADPEFAMGSSGYSNPIVARLNYLISFYSIIDLLAILPFYYAYANPNSWIDQHDEYLRMIRLLRLLKLEKYVPSISLLDDVFRLKKDILTVAGYAALTLWFLFTGAMYIAERHDHAIDIDPVPLYGCTGECSMSDRYKTYFTALPLTGIHLTGDFPLVEYGGLGRVILFFAVLAAVGVVAIPSGVIASGFAEIVESKLKSQCPEKTEKTENTNAGDDWFDIQREALNGVPPPPSQFGHDVDALQFNVLWYLEGKEDEITGEHSRTGFSKVGRIVFFMMIVTNVVAVVLESIPEIDKSVGNKSGNFFDLFEAWSVLYFTFEYFLRLFSSGKNRDALYSPWIYARTFFGLVDLLTILPWYIQILFIATGVSQSQDTAKIFRVVRIFRLLQLEDFVPAFSKLDNVFRATKDILKATGLMAMIVWVGCAALFFILEQNNPNFRECDDSVPLKATKKGPGCFDFTTAAECNAFYGADMCTQTAFQNMPQSLYYVAVFLGGEWGVVDFTVGGKLVCMFLCIAGIALYSIPVGALFDAFGAVIGLAEEEENEDTEEEDGALDEAVVGVMT